MSPHSSISRWQYACIISFFVLPSFSVTAQSSQTPDTSAILFTYASVGDFLNDFGIGIILPLKPLNNYLTHYENDNTYLEITAGFLKESHFSIKDKRPSITNPTDKISFTVDYNINQMSAGLGYGILLAEPISEEESEGIISLSIGFLSSIRYFDGRIRVSKENILKFNPNYTSSNSVEDLKFKKIEGTLSLSFFAKIKKRFFTSLAWGIGHKQYLTNNNKIAGYKFVENKTIVKANLRIGYFF